MDLPTTKTVWARRWAWLMAQLLRGRGTSPPPLAGELFPTKCFGPLGDAQQLALEGLVAGHGGAGQAPPRDPPDDEPDP